MSELWLQMGLVVALVIINAAFAGTEMAMVSLREGQLQRLGAAVGHGARAGRFGSPTEPVPGHDPDRHHPGRVPRLGSGGGVVG